MTSLEPRPRYPLLRPIALVMGIAAALTAVTGIVASLTLLAWVLALIATVVFAATFFLKRDSI